MTLRLVLPWVLRTVWTVLWVQFLVSRLVLSVALRTVKLLAGRVADIEEVVLAVPLLLIWPTSLHLFLINLRLLDGADIMGVLDAVLIR